LTGLSAKQEIISKQYSINTFSINNVKSRIFSPNLETRQRVKSGVPFAKKNLLSKPILIDEEFVIREERQSQPSIIQRPKTSGNNTGTRRNFMKTVDVKKPKPQIMSGSNIFATRKLSDARITSDCKDLQLGDSPKK